jgi:hypothetical protein
MCPPGITADAWHAALRTVADKAKQALPQSASRIDRAMALVLDGAVALQPDGSARIASQRRGQLVTWTVDGPCDCPDGANAPEGWCKHKLAVALLTRAQALVTEAPPTPVGGDPAPPALDGEPPRIPPQFLVDIQGKTFVQFAGLLALAHTRGLIRLEATLVSVTPDLALAQAVATFRDGRVFAEAGDATPQNVNTRIRPHFPRMALTRAKARALRDALDIAMVALEELSD